MLGKLFRKNGVKKKSEILIDKGKSIQKMDLGKRAATYKTHK